ncbi:MAG: alpha/beta hydrolase family protein [Planctomycetota bacterium]|jgi:dipeptidyl aminopeptidase/acylaminoacyl peptidase
MSEPEPFEIAVDGSTVTGRLQRPDRARDAPSATVLLCAPMPIERPIEVVDDLHEQLAEALLDAGIATATYRPRPPSGSGNGVGSRPQQGIDDASAVFRTLLQRPDVDRDRVGVLGYSTAALVAACLAGRTARFIAGLCFVAPGSVEGILQHAAADEQAPAPPEEFVAALRELDPIAAASAHDRPTLIVHGAADRVFPSEVAVAYQRRMQTAGHEARLVLIPRGGHAFSDVETRVACLEQVVGFFTTMARGAVGAAAK